MSDRDGNIVELYRARNLPEAHAIRLMLEREGIVVSIANEILQGIIGETAMGWSTSPRVTVCQQDADRARKLLESFAGQSTHLHSPARDDALRCLACGMAMEDEDVCSACGWSYESGHIETAATTTDAASIATDGEDETTVPQKQVAGHDDILPALSDNPVLPIPVVCLELAAVLSIGCLTHLCDSILLNVRTINEPYWSEMLQLAVYQFASAFAVLYVMSRSGERWSEFGIARPRVTDVVLGLIVMLVVWYFAAVLYVIVSRWASPTTTIYTQPVGLIDYTLMIVATVISAFSEEVIMRCYLITRLRQLLHKPWLAVVISAFLFALYHGYQGLPGLVNALFIGLIYGALFTIYPRVWPIAISHTTYNLLLTLADAA